MISEAQAFSHMVLLKPADWTTGLAMYGSEAKEHIRAVMSETDALLHKTEYGPLVYIALLGLIGIVLVTSYDPTPDIPLEIIERVVDCHEAYPLGSQICTTPSVLYEQLTR